MKIFLAILLANLITVTAFIGYQNYESKIQKEHDLKVIGALSLAESRLSLYNTRQRLGSSSLSDLTSHRESVEEMKNDAPKLAALAEEPRNSAIYASRLKDYAFKFEYVTKSKRSRPSRYRQFRAVAQSRRSRFVCHRTKCLI